MNGNQQLEVHYINTGFPYTVTDSFMDLFEGLDYVHPDLALAEALQDQESVYWSLQTYSDKQGATGSASSNSRNGHTQTHEGNEQVNNTTAGTRGWDNNSQVNNDEALAHVLQETEDSVDITNMMAAASIEECNRGHRVGSSSSQSTWQDVVDPDNMTYEVTTGDVSMADPVHQMERQPYEVSYLQDRELTETQRLDPPFDGQDIQ